LPAEQRGENRRQGDDAQKNQGANSQLVCKKTPPYPKAAFLQNKGGQI
jgi:hypothetical protein